MSKHLWMPLDIDAYLGDTGHLSLVQHAAYLLLIMRYWKDRGLPADERLIASYAHMTPEQWTENRPIIAAFFETDWQHKRIDAELAKADELTSKRRASAMQRHSKTDANAEQLHSNSSYTRVPPSPRTRSSSLRSDDHAPAKPTPRQRLEKVLDADHAEAVLEHRQRLRKPLTERAAKLMAEELGKFPDPNAAADKMIAKGWLSIDAGWKAAEPRAGPGPNGKPKTAADYLFADTMERINGHDGQPGSEAGNRTDAGELSGLAIAGAVGGPSLPRGG